ncbi:hypothetical protein EI94DRAFT_1743429 [Lactarius quietus]|nr:hypothetical protein EI94DRAFT_1743429 [Lactarius quietus]
MPKAVLEVVVPLTNIHSQAQEEFARSCDIHSIIPGAMGKCVPCFAQLYFEPRVQSDQIFVLYGWASAPQARRTLSISIFPRPRANCSGVSPWLFFALTCAPCSRSQRVRSSLPLAAATCNGVD